MAAEWLGNLTMGAMPSIASRAACDQAPIDLHDPEQRLRLRGYVWADQRARLARLDGAIDLALAAGIRVDQADAGDWLAQHLVRDATGVVTVIYHSVMWQYMPEQTQRRLTDLIEQAGHRADDGAPLAWLRFEPRSDFKAF